MTIVDRVILFHSFVLYSFGIVLKKRGRFLMWVWQVL